MSIHFDVYVEYNKNKILGGMGREVFNRIERIRRYHFRAHSP